LALKIAPFRSQWIRERSAPDFEPLF
jgi:hypothetical protein